MLITLRRWLRKMRGLFAGEGTDSDLALELESHLQHEIEDGVRGGLSATEARRQALIRMGGLEQTKIAYREQRSIPWVESLWWDIRYGARQMRKSPGFSITAVLTLALSIGSATAIFSIVDGVLLKPLAYRNSGQLVAMWERVRFLEKLFPYVGPNPVHEQTWEKSARDFKRMTLLQPGAAGVSTGDEKPRYVGQFSAQSNLLDVLDVQPVLGRNFLPEESVQGHDKVVILGWPLWQSMFHGDHDVLGKVAKINGVPYTIVGVLPENTYLPRANELSPIPKATNLPATELLTPLVTDFSDVARNSDYGNFVALGRLQAGVPLQHAQAQLDALEHNLARQMPAEYGGDAVGALNAYVQPLQEVIVGKMSASLWLLLAAVLSVLLIACVNLANAQLVRSVARDRESAVRSALGASARRLVQSALVEVALLSSIGGVLGIVLAFLAVHRIVAFAHLALARTEDIRVNPLVLTLSLVLTMGASLLFGSLPALRQLKVRPQQALQGWGRSVGSRISYSLRRWLIGFQIFACVTLLLTTGFFAKSLLKLTTLDKGFQTGHVVAANLDLYGDAFNPKLRETLDDAVLERLRALPGVQSAAVVSASLMNGESNIDGVGRVGGTKLLSNYRWISPGYFETLQQRILRGRELDDHDRTARNAILSEATAKAVFPGEDAVGRLIEYNGRQYTVIGIAADARNTKLRGSVPVNIVYLGFWERPPMFSVLLVRGLHDTTLLSEEVRKAIWTYNPGISIAGIQSLDSQVRDLLTPERLETVILSAFGGSALLLAVLGIYGTLSYSVQVRRQEIGIRMAMGASRGSICVSALRELLLPVVVGLALGWVASLGIGRSVRALLYGVLPSDAGVTLTVMAVFLVAALLATFVPCRRAARIEPMEALRSE